MTAVACVSGSPAPSPRCSAGRNRAACLLERRNQRSASSACHFWPPAPGSRSRALDGGRAPAASRHSATAATMPAVWSGVSTEPLRFMPSMRARCSMKASAGAGQGGPAVPTAISDGCCMGKRWVAPPPAGPNSRPSGSASRLGSAAASPCSSHPCGPVRSQLPALGVSSYRWPVSSVTATCARTSATGTPGGRLPPAAAGGVADRVPLALKLIRHPERVSFSHSKQISAGSPDMVTGSRIPAGTTRCGSSASAATLSPRAIQYS